MAAAALLAACSVDPASSGGPDGSVAPATTAGEVSPDASVTTEAADSSYSDWELGASPLPLRPDGLGVMPETPRQLVERKFRTADLLPPPTDGAFHSSIGPVTPEIRQRMGESWSPECPVGLDDLRYVTVTFRGFDGEAHTGELVIAASEADGVVSVFEALYAADFPIEEMRLVTTADLDAPPLGDGNNTAGLVCRPARGQTAWSAHAYGLAVDINPFNNPYLKGDVVLPELARSYLDRSWDRPGMIQPGSVAAREFARIGWSWGGDWRTLKDYQHFSKTGR